MTMIRRAASYCVSGLALSLFLACGSSARDSTDEPAKEANQTVASGTLTPAETPLEPPLRVDLGRLCIVEVKQSYAIAGTLSGSIEIDFRILVAGSCGLPPGTFDEEWIAYGTFVGTVKGSPVSGSLSYVADVKAGGEVNGRIVFGQGIEGELRVHGNFSDGRLSYEGWVI